MTREDTTSRNEAAAADHARILGASGAIGGGVGDQTPRPTDARELGPDPWGLGPVHHPTRYDLPMPVEPPF